MNARVTREERVRRNRLRLRYEVHPGERYHVRNLDVDIQDSVLQHQLAEANALPRLSEDASRLYWPTVAITASTRTSYASRPIPPWAITRWICS